MRMESTFRRWVVSNYFSSTSYAHYISTFSDTKNDLSCYTLKAKTSVENTQKQLLSISQPEFKVGQVLANSQDPCL